MSGSPGAEFVGFGVVPETLVLVAIGTHQPNEVIRALSPTAHKTAHAAVVVLGAGQMSR